MSTWFLVLALASARPELHEFPTEKACQAALAASVERQPPARIVVAACVPRYAPPGGI